MYETDENGFILIKDNPISKSGVFPYLGKNISPDLEPEKVYMVYRPESELNNPETIESFKLAPWIPFHEMLGDKYTNAEEVGVQGVTGEDVYFKDGTLFSNLKLFGNNLKTAIKNGLKELSCGFGCTWQVVSGTTPDGQHYDAIQKRIRGNHLASVPNGRMGKEVAVAMDRATFALDNLNINYGDDMNDEQVKDAIAAALAPVTEQISSLSTAMDGIAKDMKDAKKEAEEKEKKEAEDKAGEDKEKKESSKAMDSAIPIFD